MDHGSCSTRNFKSPRAINPATYAARPASSVIVTPQKTAMTTASTEDMTENAPLMPQYHAVGAPLSAYNAFFNPSGNAMPMKKPDGKSRSAEIAMRTGVEAAVRLCVTAGLTKMNAASSSGNSQIQFLIRYEQRLPQLDPISRTNNTTVRP